VYRLLKKHYADRRFASEDIGQWWKVMNVDVKQAEDEATVMLKMME